MSMKNSACEAHLLPLNKETIDKFDKLDPEIVKTLFDLEEVENGLFGLEDEPEVIEFLNDFSEKYGFSPNILILGDEDDGFQGGAEQGEFLSFNTMDKYNMTVKPEWNELPVEPEDSAWCSWG